MTAVLEPALVVAGLLHFGLLLASFSTPRVLRWHEELQKVNGLTRQLVLVHGAFIVLTIVAFGAITLVAGPDLLSGSPLALALNGFIGTFWACRLGIQVFYFDAGPWLTTPFLKFGYRALYVVFAYLALVYFSALGVAVGAYY